MRSSTLVCFFEFLGWKYIPYSARNKFEIEMTQWLPGANSAFGPFGSPSRNLRSKNEMLGSCCLTANRRQSVISHTKSMPPKSLSKPRIVRDITYLCDACHHITIVAGCC